MPALATLVAGLLKAGGREVVLVCSFLVALTTLVAGFLMLGVFFEPSGILVWFLICLTWVAVKVVFEPTIPLVVLRVLMASAKADALVATIIGILLECK